MTADGARCVVISVVHVLPLSPSPLGFADDVLTSIEANCPSSRASERALRSAVDERSRFTLSSSKTNQASAMERTCTSFTSDNNTTEGRHSKLRCNNIAELLISIGDQFKNDSENVAANMDTPQNGEDLEEPLLTIPEHNAQEVFGAGIGNPEGVWAAQTSVTRWLDGLYYLPVGRRNA